MKKVEQQPRHPSLGISASDSEYVIFLFLADVVSLGCRAGYFLQLSRFLLTSSLTYKILSK